MGRVAARAQQHRAEVRLVEAQVPQRVAQLAEGAQRPQIGALGGHRGRCRRRRRLRRGDGQRGGAGGTVELDLDVAVADAVGLEAGLERRQLDTRAAGDAGHLLGQRHGALAHAGVEARLGQERVDQAPLDGALALHALGDGAEHVGPVAPHLALVDQAGEPAGAGQDGEQRRLGKRDRRRAVVDEDDLVAGEGQLVAAAGRGALARGQEAQPASARRVLHGHARLVGELAEVDLERVRRGAEHVDVGAGAEHAVEVGRDDDGADLRVLEAQPLDGVGQLDVDREVVGVELELVAGAERMGRIDRHAQARQARVVGVDLEAPVVITAGMGVEANRVARLRGVGHGRLSTYTWRSLASSLLLAIPAS